MRATRYSWIDWLKAIGIVLILVAHTPLPDLISPGFAKWRSAVAVPVFFCVTGFLIAPGRFNLPLGEFARGRIKRILCAYLLFACLGVVHLCLLSQLGRSRAPLADVAPRAILAAVYGSGHYEALPNLLVYPLALWYLPAAVLANLLVFFCWIPARNWVRGLLVASVFLLGMLAHNLALPWGLQSACVAVLFVSAGQLMRRHPGWVKRLAELRPFAVLVILALGTELIIHNERFNFRGTDFGNPLLSFPAVFLLVSGCACIAMRLPGNGLVTLMSESTLLVFGAHSFVFWFLDDVVRSGLGMPEAVMAHSIWYQCLKIGVTFLVLLVAYRPLVRILPFLGRADKTGSLRLALAPGLVPALQSVPQPRSASSQNLPLRQ